MRYHKIAILGFFLFFLTAAHGQNESHKIENACCRYEICLKTENLGTITSTLIHVTRLYYLYPQKDFSRISAQLDTLIMHEKSDQITLMAKMVKQYLNHERDLDWMMAYSYEEIYNFFTLLPSSGLSDVALKD